MGAPHHDIATRAQALALLQARVPIDRVSKISGISVNQIYRIDKKARERGYDPTTSTILSDDFLIDAPRSGRPKKITEEMEQEIIQEIRKSRNGREKSAVELGWQFDISDASAIRTLHKHNLRKYKPSYKPGLTEEMRAARLKFAREHRYNLEWWKNIIWTDETSIVLGHCRGAIRVWRTASERFDPTVMRERWNGASEFMFWGSFSYDKKGPFHIWKTETKKEKEAAKKELDTLNAIAEPEAKAAWELATAMRRLNLRGGTRGRKPV
jgi:transposase